jgi:hypothetical protein
LRDLGMGVSPEIAFATDLNFMQGANGAPRWIDSFDSGKGRILASEILLHVRKVSVSSSCRAERRRGAFLLTAAMSSA